MLRVSALSWATLYQLITITPEDILEITAYVGKETEELAQFLEGRFPSIQEEFARRYIAVVMSMLPVGSVPTIEEVCLFANSLVSRGAKHQHVRDDAVEKFYGIVNQDSPEYTKRAMMALVEFSIGNWEEALHSAGFAQCNFEYASFDQNMERGSKDSTQDAILSSERKKAEVLIEIISERRKN